MRRSTLASEPFAQLVARALRTEVEEVLTERATTSPLVEVDRVRWRGSGGEGRLLFCRFHESAPVEAQLLPFLSRKGLPVPRVIARGVPPPHAPERRPWLLLDDLPRDPLPRDAAWARRAAETLRTIQRETARDEPALSALGLPLLPPARIRTDAIGAVDLLERDDAGRLRALAERCDAEALEALGFSLAHGDYTTRNLVARADGVVVVDWLRAHLGCPLQDLAWLAADLRRADAALARGAVEAYGAEGALLADAERLQRLFAIRWQWRLVERGVRAKSDAAARVRALLAEDART